MKFDLYLPLTLAVMVVFTSGLASAQVQLELRNDIVKVTEPTVHVRDVVSAGTTTNRAVLALDLDSFSRATSEVRISKRQIQIRLLLAGFDDVEINGPDELRVVRIKKRDGRQLIETRLQSHLANQYTIPESALHVALSSNFRFDSRKNLNFETLQIENWANADIPLGRQTFIGTVQDSRGESHRVSVPVEVAIYRDLAVAKQDISRGTILTTDNIQSVRRLVTNKQQGYLTLNHALGKLANSDIEMYAVLKRNSIKATSNVKEKLIEKNHFVDAVLRSGRLTVTLRDVKTLQAGNKGEIIQVLNLNNQETLYARVLDANTVQLR